MRRWGIPLAALVGVCVLLSSQFRERAPRRAARDVFHQGIRQKLEELSALLSAREQQLSTEFPQYGAEGPSPPDGLVDTISHRIPGSNDWPLWTNASADPIHQIRSVAAKIVSAPNWWADPDQGGFVLTNAWASPLAGSKTGDEVNAAQVTAALIRAGVPVVNMSRPPPITVPITIASANVTESIIPPNSTTVNVDPAQMWSTDRNGTGEASYLNSANVSYVNLTFDINISTWPAGKTYPPGIPEDPSWRVGHQPDYLCLIAGDCHIPGNPTASYCCCINATNETECAGEGFASGLNGTGDIEATADVPEGILPGEWNGAQVWT